MLRWAEISLLLRLDVFAHIMLSACLLLRLLGDWRCFAIYYSTTSFNENEFCGRPLAHLFSFLSSLNVISYLLPHLFNLIHYK